MTAGEVGGAGGGPGRGSFPGGRGSAAAGAQLELRGRGAGPPARPAARPRWQQSTALGWTFPLRSFLPLHCCTPLPPLPPSPPNLGNSLITWILNKFSPHHHQTINVSRMYLFIYLFASKLLCMVEKL